MTTPFPFVAGQVLTAAQLNSISELPTRTLTATGNAVAADRYSRVILNGSSISYTVNSATFDVGEVVHLYNINSTAATIAAGTGGVTINAAAGLTLAQYQGATLYAVSSTSFILWKTDVTQTAAGLTLISNTAHSAASSVSVDNVFSSTYTNYRLIWQSSFSASLTPTMRFRAGGTATTSSYAFQFVIGSSTTVTANRGTAQANLDIFGGASAGPLLAIYDIYGPNLAANTAGSGIVNMLYGGNLVHHNYSIAQQGTTQFDGVEINASANNMTGNLWIYGYRKDV